MAVIVAAAGAAGNWTVGATWVGGIAPTAADDAQITATTTSITIDAGAVARSVDFTGFIGTATHNAAATLTIGDATAGLGNVALTLVAGMTYTLGSATTSAISFISTSATVQTVNFAGKTSGNVSYAPASGGSWQLTGAHNTGATATVTLTRGTLDLNGQAVSWGIFDTNNSNTRTLTMGASAITLASTSSSAANFSTVAGITITANTATMTLSGVSAGFNSGTLNFNGLSVVFTGGSTPSFSGTGAPVTIANLTYTGTASRLNGFSFAHNVTITGTLTLTANSLINRLFVQSNTPGTSRTLTVGILVASNVIDFVDINGAGAATWTTAASGATYFGDAGGNSGITTTVAATQTWSGTSGGNWSSNAWTSRVPLPQDDVVVNAAFVAAQTVTIDMPRVGRSVNFTGLTGAPTINFSGTGSGNFNFYGSLTLIAGITIAVGTKAFIFSGRGAFNITVAGRLTTSNTAIALTGSVGGTYTLQDSMDLAVGSSNNSIIVNDGTLNDNGQIVSCWNFITGASGNRTRGLTATGSWSLFATTAVDSWQVTSSTGLTMLATAITITISTASASTRTFRGGSQSYGTLTYTIAGSTGALNILGSNTFGTLNFSDASNARSLQFTATTTTTITGAFNVNGTAGRLMSINSITAASHFLSKSSGMVSSDFLNITNSSAGGGAPWYAGANSVDGGGNTGWIFTIPIFPGRIGQLMLLGVGQ